MWFDYLKEREQLAVVKSDDGFALFKYEEHDGKYMVYIKDIYVKPDKRKTHEATRLANRIIEQAKEHGISECYGSVDVTDPRADDNMHVLISFGMHLSHTRGNLVFFVKEI